MSRKLSIAIIALIMLSVVIIKTDACPPPENDPPVAVLYAVPATAGAGVNVILDGSGSYDPDGSIILYYWDWDNDGNADYHETSSNYPDGAFDGNTVHAYSIPGTYTAKLWAVDDGYPLKNDTDTCTVTILRVTNATQNTGYTTIQAALDDANDGDVIVVHPDTYYENIDFNGVSCTLTSTDPNDPNIIVSTIIDANGSGDVVTLNSGETADCLLTGFTITNGTYGIDCNNSSPAITKCLIEDNSSAGIYCSGSASPIIRNNWIYDNDKGIEFADSNSTAAVTNNTIVDNTNYGIKGTDTSPTITNCIIWQNSDDLSTCTATYSCIEDGDSGTGNISSYPYFEDYNNNDFHLTRNSPCINAGDPDGIYTGQADIDGDARVMYQKVDIGADETLYLFVYNLTQDVWYTSLQSALDEADTDDTIKVYPGIYYETIDFNGVSCTLTSNDPNDWDVVAATIIDCQASRQSPKTGFIFDHNEGSDSILEGFTVINGYGQLQHDYYAGGAIYCEGSSPTIRRCVLRNNTNDKTNSDTDGGAIACYLDANPLIESCVIFDNEAYYSGGISVWESSPTIRNCLIYNNSAVIGGSIATWSSNDVEISNCTITNNSADTGGGIYSNDSNETITNCVLWNNGDDLYDCDATYSCIEDGDAGTGNISSYPYFADYANDDFHITLNSPCINRGDPNGSYTGQIDIDGEDRVADEMFIDARVDMGADELHLDAGNMVKNPGFELGGGWTVNRSSTSSTIPLYWQDQWVGTPPKSIDPNEKHSGDYSWKFENDGSEYVGAYSDYIEVDSDNTYIVSAWMKCQTKKERTYFRWQESDNNQNYLLDSANFVLYNDLIDTEWTKYSGGYSPRHPDTANVRLLFFGPSYSYSGTVWWDDFSLIDIGTQFLPPYGYANETGIAETVDFGAATGSNEDFVAGTITDYMSGPKTDSDDNNITYRDLLTPEWMSIDFPEFNVDYNDYNCPQTPMLLEIMYKDVVDGPTDVVVASKIDCVDRDPCYWGSESWSPYIGHLGGYNDNRWKYFQYAFQKTDYQLLRAIGGNYRISLFNISDVNLPIDYVSLRKITQAEYEDLANKQRAARGFYEPELPEDAPAEPNYTDPNITVFTRDIMRPVYRYTMPGANEVDANITGFSAWGVVEPVSFSIYSENGVNDLTITVSDLANGTDTISSNDISIYHVIYDETRLNFNQAPRTYALVPDRLEEFTTFSVEPNTAERIWLKIKVQDSSDGKAAGLYQGNVTISRTGEPNETVPIDFTIYDITLDDPNHINPVWASPFCGVYSNDINVTFDAYRETGFDPMCAGRAYYITASDNNGIPAFDSNNFETAMNRMVLEGHARDKVNLYIWNYTWEEIYEIVFDTDFNSADTNLYYDLSDTDFVNAFESLLARYEQIADDLNIEFIYHIFDEPGGKPYERLVSDRLYTIIGDYNEPNEPNDLLTGVTYNSACDDDVNVSPYNAPDGNTIPALTDLVDYKMWWMQRHAAFGYTRHQDPNYHGHFGYYTTGQSNLRNPVYNRFLHGLFAFGTDARVVYAYSMGSYVNDPYNDFDASSTHVLPFTNPDFIFAYPTWSGKLLYTIGGLEAIREGIKDARYIATLRNIIDDPNTDPNDQDVIDANDFLDDLHDRIDPNFTNYHTRTTALGYYHRILDEITDPNDPNDPNDFDTFTYIRKTIADHIRDIQP